MNRNTDHWADDTLGNLQSTSRDINPVIVNKTVDIKFSAHDTFNGITFIRYDAQNRKVGKTNNSVKKFWPKQDN
jgi:hypothetical protein